MGLSYASFFSKQMKPPTVPHKVLEKECVGHQSLKEHYSLCFKVVYIHSHRITLP